MCLKTGAVKDVREIDERADVSHVSSNVVERDNSSALFDAALFIRQQLQYFKSISVVRKQLTKVELEMFSLGRGGGWLWVFLTAILTL